MFPGGCEDLPRPATVLACNPPCTLPNSVCNDTNYCVCLENHEPVNNRLNVLIECVRMDNSTAASPASDSVTIPSKSLVTINIVCFVIFHQHCEGHVASVPAFIVGRRYPCVISGTRGYFQ